MKKLINYGNYRRATLAVLGFAVLCMFMGFIFAGIADNADDAARQAAFLGYERELHEAMLNGEPTPTQPIVLIGEEDTEHVASGILFLPPQRSDMRRASNICFVLLIAALATAVAIMFLHHRCPHCGGYKGRGLFFNGNHCRWCGKEID